MKKESPKKGKKGEDATPTVSDTEEDPYKGAQGSSKKKQKKEDEAEYQDDYYHAEVPSVKYQQGQAKKVPIFLVTREIGKRYLDRERYLKVCLVEMLIYIFFLLNLGLLAAFQHHDNEYYLSRVMTKLFVERSFKIQSTGNYEVISFNEINTLDQLWEYLAYYVVWTDWQYWYSDMKRVGAVEENTKHMQFYNNRLIGRPRIRQLRVKRGCDMPKDMEKFYGVCYSKYSSATMTKKHFGISWKNTTLEGANATLRNPRLSPNAWKYHPASALGSQSISGEISTYDGGGFIIDVVPEMRVEDKTKQADNILDVKKRKNIKEQFAEWLWIDRATRALVLQFTTYNANENIFFTLQQLFELPPTGGVLPSHRIFAEKFLVREQSDSAVLIFFIIFCLFVLGYTLSEVFEMVYFNRQYFDHFWNFFDLLILILCYIAIALFVYSFIVVNTISEVLREASEGGGLKTSFDPLNNAKENFATFIAVVFFFAAVKMLKYMNFNHAMFQMQTTLSKATKDVACFSIMFFIVFITFAQLGHLLFGSQVRDFRSFIHSIFALLRTAVGDFDYHKIENVNHFLGPVFFFAYIFFIYFILVNMFLAIIIDTYSEVRTSLRDQGKELQMSDIVCGFFGKIFHCCKKKQPDGAASPHKGNRVYSDIQSLLRMCGFTEMEIDLFFAKFDIPKDKHIPRQEMRDKLLTNFNIQPQDQGKAPTAPETDDIGEKLMNRIQVLENNIADVNSKIDLIDSKIDAIQQIRARRTQDDDKK